MPDEEPDDFHLPAVRRPVKRVQAGARTAGGADPVGEEMLSHLGAAEKTGAGKRFVEGLRLGGELPGFMPLNDRAAVTTGRPLEQRREPREVPREKPLHGLVKLHWLSVAHG